MVDALGARPRFHLRRERLLREWRSRGRFRRMNRIPRSSDSYGHLDEEEDISCCFACDMTICPEPGCHSLYELVV
jgi:hypothetical protein